MMKAKKRLGQNFLHDEAVLEDIIKAGDLSPMDTVLEIGPGKGALTRELLKKAGTVIAVEKDEDLIFPLKLEFLGQKNFHLIQGDALRHSPPEGAYKVIANIPYYITSPLINHFLREQFEQGHPPTLLVLMVQKEVAEKIVAKNGNHSLLSLEVQLFAEASIVRTVPASAFHPRPEVDSAVIKIRPLSTPRIEGDLKKIFWLFHVSFAQKRKKLSNNLSGVLHKKPHEITALLESLAIDPGIRAEALSFPEWQKLFNALGSDLPSF